MKIQCEYCGKMVLESKTTEVETKYGDIMIACGGCASRVSDARAQQAYFTQGDTMSD